MIFVSGNKSILKSNSRSWKIKSKDLRKFPHYGDYSMGGTSKSNYFTKTIWYKHPLEIILQAFGQEMIQPLGIELPPSTL